MTNQPANTSPLIYARVAGLLYLSMLPLGLFGILYVSPLLIVPGEAAATAINILASESLFRLSIAIALILQIINIFVVLALYRLLKPVNKSMASLMVVFILVAVPIAMLNELNRLAILLLLNGSVYKTVFTAAQVQALVPLFLDLHEHGITIAGLFWGLWLFPMGFLVFKSGFLPRILGILLVIGCLGYLIDSFGTLLIPNFEVNVAIFSFWGEVLFPLWLVIKGVNVERWQKRALEST